MIHASFCLVRFSNLFIGRMRTQTLTFSPFFGFSAGSAVEVVFLRVLRSPPESGDNGVSIRCQRGPNPSGRVSERAGMGPYLRHTSWAA